MITSLRQPARIPTAMGGRMVSQFSSSSSSSESSQEGEKGEAMARPRAYRQTGARRDAGGRQKPAAAKKPIYWDAQEFNHTTSPRDAPTPRAPESFERNLAYATSFRASPTPVARGATASVDHGQQPHVPVIKADVVKYPEGPDDSISHPLPPEFWAGRYGSRMDKVQTAALNADVRRANRDGRIDMRLHGLREQGPIIDGFREGHVLDQLRSKCVTTDAMAGFREFERLTIQQRHRARTHSPTNAQVGMYLRPQEEDGEELGALEPIRRRLFGRKDKKN
jgi:hypothetical protein